MPSLSFFVLLTHFSHLLLLFRGAIRGLDHRTMHWRFWPCDVLRFELNSNIWSSNNSLVAQRGVFLWVGDQGSDTSNNAQQQPFPILTVLSTFYNQTYISTSSSGSQDAPCPDSYTYNSNSGPDANWDDCCTFNSSYTCKGYYDLTTSTPIYLETSSNYTGSPEDVEASSEVQDADVKYGITYTSLVLPSTYGAQTTTGTGTSISHYGLGDQLLGFVNNHQDQILGLGLNSTFINFLYAGGVYCFTVSWAVLRRSGSCRTRPRKKWVHGSEADTQHLAYKETSLRIHIRLGNGRCRGTVLGRSMLHQCPLVRKHRARSLRLALSPLNSLWSYHLLLLPNFLPLPTLQILP